MQYTAADLVELRGLADEALDLLTKFADVAAAPAVYPLHNRIEQVARTFELVGWTAERDAIVTAYKSLDLYVEIRCRHKRDAESSFSILNYYPEGHKLRRPYEVRVAEERRTLAGFPLAKARILATVEARLKGSVLDATLASIRSEPITAKVAAEAVRLSEVAAA